MNKEEVQDVLDKYGLDRILEDNCMTLCCMLEIMQDLGYIDLEMYDEQEGDKQDALYGEWDYDTVGYGV